jgi:hypothetical protein
MSTRPLRPLATAAAALLLSAMLAAPALGQSSRRNEQPDVLEPPSMGSLKQTDSVLPRLGMAMVIAAMVIGVNLIPSKRGHQD